MMICLSFRFPPSPKHDFSKMGVGRQSAPKKEEEEKKYEELWQEGKTYGLGR